MSIYGIYFSCTNNSKKVVEAMAKTLDSQAIIYDVTTKALNVDTFTQDDFVIIGAPVYGGKIPAICRKRFLAFKGNQTPCVLVATYGNRHYDDALVEMQDLFENNGFIVYGACSMVGRHTYGEIQVNRPNQIDLNEAIEFAKEIKIRNTKIQSKIPGNLTDKPNLAKGNFHPLTSDNCIGCMICVNQCPVQAISEDCSTISDACISCFRCIRNCPVQAKNMNDEKYLSFAAMFTEKLKERKENEFFK